MKASAELDVKLLCDALRSSLRRFEDLALEQGYSVGFVRACTEADYALLNRCQLQLETEVSK